MNKNLKRLGALAVALASLLSLMVIPSHAAVFSDVPQTFWGYEEINRMSALGYVKGYEDGTFKPHGEITAIETLMLCARATGIDSGTQVKIARDRKSEVEEILPKTNNMNVWAAPEMAVALETGILSASELKELSWIDPASPYGRTYLEETISRENICMYLTRAMQLEPLAKSLSNTPLGYKYKDANLISADTLPYVYVLTNYGVVKGKETGNFDPQGVVTRAEMATMLCRALAAMEELGIKTELSEYTDYRWYGGVISAMSEGHESGSVIVTLRDEASETTQSYYVPATAKIYRDNVITNSSALRANQYVRLNLDDDGAVADVRMGGTVTLYSGPLDDMDLENSTVSLISDGRVHTLAMDRFTQVVIGKRVGGQDFIDPAAGYTTVDCYVDATGHLAAVRFFGGTELQTGQVENPAVNANGINIFTDYQNVAEAYTALGDLEAAKAILEKNPGFAVPTPTPKVTLRPTPMPQHSPMFTPETASEPISTTAVTPKPISTPEVVPEITPTPEIVSNDDFTIENGAIKKYNGRGGVVAVPAGVTSIGNNAFRNCTGLISVVIPNSVTNIGYSAFENCTGLISVTIPNSVTHIDGYAFSGCTGLTSVTIPDSVICIEHGAFQDCASLASVTIPSSMTTISGWMFKNCTSLTHVTIPDSVTTMTGTSVFKGCTGLTSVTISNKVTGIADETFQNCTSLASVVIPNSVTSIDASAFENCTSLTSITIPNSVTCIEYYAFRNCTKLTSIIIPDNVTEIWESAFYSCPNLTVYCSVGSRAEEYCRDHDINYVAS